jgi:quinol monooxygenase YgiN
MYTPFVPRSRAQAARGFLLSLLLILVAGAARPLAQQRTQGAPGAPASFPDLVTPLRAIPGCLGVEVARTDSGKQVIFAWFEDKEAALRWFMSDAHQGAIRSFSPDLEPEDEPMSEVPDEVGPILAIASITFDKEPRLDSVALPISQIAVELYTPLRGGLALGGRFAPSGLVVPKRKVLVDKE